MENEIFGKEVKTQIFSFKITLNQLVRVKEKIMEKTCVGAVARMPRLSKTLFRKETLKIGQSESTKVTVNQIFYGSPKGINVTALISKM